MIRLREGHCAHSTKLRRIARARFAGFFGMELHGQQIIVFDHRGKWEAVIADSGGVRIATGSGVGMREVKIGVVCDSLQQNSRTQWPDLVPADVRRLYVFRQRFHLMVNEIEAQFSGGFFAGCE